MATTPNLGLTLPTVGADDDTWGTIQNTLSNGIDALFAADGSGTSVGLKVGSGKTLNAIGGTVNVSDSTFSVKDNSDATKILQFQASGITTATTRTLTAPDANGTIALVQPSAYAEKGSGQTVTSGAGAAVITYTSVVSDGVTYASDKATIVTAGRYRVDVSFDMTFTTLATMDVHLRKGGSNIKRLFSINGGVTVEYCASAFHEFAAVANDEIDVTIAATGTGTLTLQGSSPQVNSFKIVRISA